MKPVEIMAFLLAAAVVVKLVAGFVSPEFWLNAVAKRAWSNPILTTLISLAWAVAALIFLLEELTIVQIFAAMLFLAPLMMMSLAPFVQDLLALWEKEFKDRTTILKKAWLSIIIWLALAVWVLYALFV